MKWVLAAAFAIFLFVHVPALAQHMSAEAPAPAPETSEAALAVGLQVPDENAPLDFSSGAIVVPSAPGGINAPEGPAAGRQLPPVNESDSEIPPPQGEAVP